MTIPFNLKKYAQELPPEQDDFSVPQNPMGEQIETIADPMEQQQQFATDPANNMNEPSDHQQLKQLLDQMGDEQNARDWFLQKVGENEMIKVEETGETVNARQYGVDALSHFYQIPATDPQKEEHKLDEAHKIFQTLPQNDQGGIIATEKDGPEMGVQSSVDYNEMVKSFSDHIQKLAKLYVKKNQPFNLKKTAQAKTVENVMVWGPSEKRFDPFLRQPISDWHIVERNKGFGLTVDDRWNIDWEAIWRGNIMDKYSRPYRDKDGNWVGGYIQKRFEVDKWIPERNNYQLKPGQRRRPIVPEHGITESRLEAQRASGDIKYVPNTKDKPFNWNKAQAQEKLTKQSLQEDLFAKLEKDQSKLNKVQSLYNDSEFSQAYKLAGIDENNIDVKAEFVSKLYDYKLAEDKKKSNIKLAQLSPIRPLGDPSKPGPKGILDPQNNIKPQYKCSRCGAQLGSPGGAKSPVNCKDDCKKNNGMPFPWSEVAVLSNYKNEPDKPGKQNLPQPVKSLNQILGSRSEVIFNSNTKQYKLAQMPMPPMPEGMGGPGGMGADPFAAPLTPPQPPVVPKKKKKQPKIISVPTTPRVKEEFTSDKIGNPENDDPESKYMRDGDMNENNMIDPIKRMTPGHFRNNGPKVENTDDDEGYLDPNEASNAADALGIDG